MVPNAVEKLSKFTTACVGCTSVTDRQTDGRQQIANVAKKYGRVTSCLVRMEFDLYSLVKYRTQLLLQNHAFVGTVKSFFRSFDITGSANVTDRGPAYYIDLCF